MAACLVPQPRAAGLYPDSAPPLDPATLAFDIDGVVADTMGLFLDLARKEYGVRNIAYGDITDYHLESCLDMDPAVLNEILARLIEGDYNDPLRPIEGAVPVLSRMGRHNGGLLFVTARPHEGPIGIWLQTVLDLVPEAIQVVATGSFEAKLAVLEDHGKCAFVEDRLETCHHLSAAGIEPILFKQPWNRNAHPYREVADWRELADLIDFATEPHPTPCR